MDDLHRDWLGDRFGALHAGLVPVPSCDPRSKRVRTRGVIFRLGHALPKAKGPGLILVFVPVDRIVRVDLRTVAKVIEPQDVITRDNVSVKVDAVLYYRVVDPMKAVLVVENYVYGISQVALTTLRSTLGRARNSMNS